tara:strand:+ start:522 stop:785 length:264 start_codon:yes stop_codon:yes gene_type:complete
MNYLNSKLENLIINFLLFLIRIYKIFLSPHLGQNCRYHPTCSSYAQESLKIHGLKKGVILSVKRISKCHPLGGSGVDLVPEKKDLKN